MESFTFLINLSGITSENVINCSSNIKALELKSTNYLYIVV